jgi:hypothetical protein
LDNILRGFIKLLLATNFGVKNFMMVSNFFVLVMNGFAPPVFISCRVYVHVMAHGAHGRLFLPAAVWLVVRFFQGCLRPLVCVGLPHILCLRSARVSVATKCNRVKHFSSFLAERRQTIGRKEK